MSPHFPKHFDMEMELGDAEITYLSGMALKNFYDKLDKLNNIKLGQYKLSFSNLKNKPRRLVYIKFFGYP